MNDHYFSAHPPSDAEEEKLLRVPIRGHDLQMWVSRQVFSAGRLDPGTTELLRALPPMPPTGRFLDLGCGWGPVAVTLALESPHAQIWAVDVNPRALELTRKNAYMNEAPNIDVLNAEDALEAARDQNVLFERIISNPPVRIGKEALHTLLLDWLGQLASEGEAWMVMSKNLGADSLTKWLSAQGYSATKVSSRKGFRILRVTH